MGKSGRYLRRCCIAAISLVPLFQIALAEDDRQSSKPKLTFQNDVFPIFRAKCIRCHAGVEPKGDLNLTQPAALLVGGASGPAIRIAAAEFSLLYEKVSADEMPAAGAKLTPEEKGVIRTWINEGAAGVGSAASVDRTDEITGIDLWSFKPPVRGDLPPVAAQHRVRNPIDMFVLHELEDEQLGLSPDADRQVLLRRASFDLLGLPPSPTEVEQFLEDDRPDAHERMIDRLLASPHYGERWGRHWLDVAGYADSAGILNEDRPLQLTWRYRDYVIRAFNDDKPYDRFLQEQIAGDELTNYWDAFENLDRLPDRVVEGLTATGFLRTAADPSRPDFSTIKNADALYYYPTLFDTLQIVCSTTMGLTVQCARCHSHKFDPIPQVDYYRMQAVFMNALRPAEWIPQMQRRLLVATKKQKAAADQRNAEIDERVETLKETLASLPEQFIQRLFELRLKELPEEIREDVKVAVDVAAERRTAIQKYLVEKFHKRLKPSGKELEAALSESLEDYRTQAEKLNAAIASHEQQRRHFDELRALYDLPGEVTTPVLLRGDPLTPGPEVEPGVISTIETPEPFDWTPPPTGARSSRRRLAFARWLTQKQHPLTARVMVNRIWMHHFGTGIVSTPEDFGVSGAPPSHPELLDWLATEFVESGWSIKHMHRLILNSSTWRQRSSIDSRLDAIAVATDPENRLLWRQNMRRLEAEPMRDALLAASGKLSRSLYGYSQPVKRLANGEVVLANESSPRRRSIYVTILRLNPETLLEAFDQPEMAVNCTQRSNSTVSTQALTLLNSDLMVQSAMSFAERSLAERPADPAHYAVLAAFSRPATVDENRLFAKFLEDQTASLADLCHMLLSANEFAYVD